MLINEPGVFINRQFLPWCCGCSFWMRACGLSFSGRFLRSRLSTLWGRIGFRWLWTGLSLWFLVGWRWPCFWNCISKSKVLLNFHKHHVRDLAFAPRGSFQNLGFSEAENNLKCGFSLWQSFRKRLKILAPLSISEKEFLVESFESDIHFW